MQVDIAANRAVRNYTNREMVLRVLWLLGAALFRMTPPRCFTVRRWLLRLFGATVGAEVNIDSSTRIYFPWNLTVGDWTAIGEHVLIYNLGQVSIGRRATISHGAHLCAGTHDYRRVDLPLRKPPIIIGDQVWICTEAYVGPGVSVHTGAVVAARAVVTRNVPAWSVVAGNPARVTRTRELLASE